MAATALRTSLIWHDEVMNDLVTERPARITLGASSASTFVVPELGLPAEFAVVSPGRRGYLLTLGERMRGTVCVGGVEHDVAELVQADNDGGFHALAIGGHDWGVVDLDDTGHYKLFFQFVELGDERWMVPRPVLIAAAIGYLLCAIVLALVWSATGLSTGESVARGVGLSTLALGAAAATRALMKQDNEARASLAFSVVLHAALLFVTFQLYVHETPFVWPGPRALTGDYLITRINAPEPPKPAAAAPAPTVSVVSPAPGPTLPPLLPAPRLRSPRINADPPRSTLPPGAAPGSDAGVLQHRDILGGVLGRDLGGITGRVAGLDGPRGDETPGPRGGPRTRGGNGNDRGSVGDRRPTGPLDTGPMRAQVCVGRACGGGPTEIKPPPNRPVDDGPTLTEAEIDRVIRDRAAMFRTCYQKQLDKVPGLAGDVVIRFTIDGDGKVPTTRLHGGSMHDDNVADCVQRAIRLLRFPAKGGALVTYPFMFSPGG